MKYRISLPALFIITGMIFSFSGFSQPGDSWKPRPDVLERLSKNGNKANYDESKVPEYTLPDLFTSIDGRSINTPELWNKVRRPEILELFRENVFGRIPATKYEKSFVVKSVDRNALDGKAVRKEVIITIKRENKSLSFTLILVTPKSGKPVPVFLLIDPWMNEAGSDHWKRRQEYWPVAEAISRGYGMAVFDASEIDPDNFDNFKNGIHGILDQQPRPADAWGTLAAWAWGAGRCLDYLVADKDVAGDKVAVVGHSRAGKTALWAGAEDQRFAMVIANESGAGGAAIARRRYGETVERLNTVFPHWYCRNFSKFSDHENDLPVDMHMLLALAAPRPLYVACADEDLWGDPYGSYLSLYNALPVFQLLGLRDDIPMTMPPLDKQVIYGNLGFHIRSGEHNLLLNDWKWFMNFADANLK